MVINCSKYQDHVQQEGHVDVYFKRVQRATRRSSAATYSCQEQLNTTIQRLDELEGAPIAALGFTLP